MKNIWVLSVKTSLPDACIEVSDIKTEISAFENFDDAKQALGNKFKEFAFSENAMFDGEGNIIYFKKYVDAAWEPEEDEEVYEGFLTQKNLTNIYNMIKGIFYGKSCDLSQFEDIDYYDGLIGLQIDGDAMLIRGEDDGPINGYNPKFATNMFDMEKEKDYYFYIDDGFGQEYESSELYIDLKKVELV